MDKTIVVTAGKRYLDIDAYASMVAYCEFLRALGKNSVTMSSVSTNETVPDFLRFPEYTLAKDTDLDDVQFVLVDVSNPEHFDPIVSDDKIIEVIDHHDGYAQYWKEREGVQSQIEFIGAACTIIFERFALHRQIQALTPELCKLLAAGILDNTLNLKAKITTQRDVDAYKQLLKLGKLPENWHQEYFMACNEGILRDPKKAILGDMKAEKSHTLLPAAIGQAVLLDHTRLDESAIKDIFQDFGEWMINIISLQDSKSYIYFDGSDLTQRNLERVFGAPAECPGLMILDKFLLRKEIFKLASRAETEDNCS